VQAFEGIAYSGRDNVVQKFEAKTFPQEIKHSVEEKAEGLIQEQRLMQPLIKSKHSDRILLGQSLHQLRF
jgi:hypothetical protein